MIDLNLNAEGVHLYYVLLFGLSALLTFIYSCGWHKHFDVHITLVYVLVPIANLGFMLRAQAVNLQEALAMNKICYLGGCYMELVMLLAVFSLCGIRLPALVRSFFFLLSTAMYFGVLTTGQNDLFYRNVSFAEHNGIGELVREYGWMHTAFQVMVVVYLALSLGVILYSYLRKTQISRKILLMLLLPVAVAVIAFIGGSRLVKGLDPIPASFVVAQVVYLLIAAKIPRYDVTDGAIDTLVQDGDTGLISVDAAFRYLGSNERAKKLFPALNKLTVDRPISGNAEFRDLVKPWLADFRDDERRDTEYYEKDDRIYRVLISWLYSHGKKKIGYQMTLMDDTYQQKNIRIMNEFNSQLERDVDEKTLHIREMHNKLILGMASMVESRDNSTGGHIRRTSEGVKILLMAMGDDGTLTRSERRNMIKAAPMHDLGKIAVDDAILRKPGRFEPEEYEKMKAHAPEGARIVREILKGTDDAEFSRIAENMAHYHHERWDGSGYPDGLKGEEIPLEARIMAIADVYDALVSKRVYKEKIPFGKADGIMMEGMGTQFDPGLKAVYEEARPALEAYYSMQKD